MPSDSSRNSCQRSHQDHHVLAVPAKGAKWSLIQVMVKRRSWIPSRLSSNPLWYSAPQPQQGSQGCSGGNSWPRPPRSAGSWIQGRRLDRETRLHSGKHLHGSKHHRKLGHRTNRLLGCSHVEKQTGLGDEFTARLLHAPLSHSRSVARALSSSVRLRWLEAKNADWWLRVWDAIKLSDSVVLGH